MHKLTRMHRCLAAGSVLSVLPGAAFASDPTSLFVVVVGMPAALCSMVLVWLAWRFPRTGLVLAIASLAAHAPLIHWAHGVGHMVGAGGWLYFSAALGFVSLVLAMLQIGRPRADGQTPDAGGG